MFCPQCGKQLDDSIKFCDQCGCNLAEQSATSATESAEVAQPVNTLPEMVRPVAENVQSVFSENTIPTMAMPTADTTTASATATEAPAVATEAPSTENVLPQMAVAQKPASEKKSGGLNKKSIIGISAGAAALIAAGVTVSGLTFAKADFAHTFMGAKKYSAAVLSEQVEKVVNSPIMSVVNVANSTQSDINAGTGLANMAKQFTPENGFEIEGNLNLDMTAEQLQNFLSELDIDVDAEWTEEQTKAVLDALNDVSVKGGLQFTETGIAGSASLKEGDSDFIKANLYYDAEEEAWFIAVPDAFDKSIKLADEEMVVDMEVLNSDDDGESAKEMLKNVFAVYTDSLENAEITYGKGEFSIGAVQFKGKVNTVVFQDDELADMIVDVAEEFFDSEYADNFGDTSSMESTVETLAEMIENSKSTTLTIENFMNGNNTPAGMRVEIEVKTESGEKNSFEIAYLDTKDGIAVVAESDGKETFELVEERESKTAGKYTLKLNDDGETSKITVGYEQKTVKEMFGADIQLGEYSIKFTGEMFEDAPEKVSVKLSDEENKLNVNVDIKDEENSFGFNVSVSEGMTDTINTDTMKISEAIDMAEDEKADDEYSAKLLKHISEKVENSKLLTSIIVEDDVTAADEMSASIKKELRQYELAQNYSEYNEETIYNTKREARNIYNTVRNYTYSIPSRNAVKVKLYIDKDGKVSVIDDAGVKQGDYAAAIEKLGYKNSYVEIVLWDGRGPVCGVNVVKTDDKGNLPTNLPDAYSFLDRLYNWGTNQDINYSGSFVVGTYPVLSNGEGGKTAENDKLLADKVKASNEDAKKAVQAISAYTGLTFSDGNSFIRFTVNEGKWSVRQTGGERITGDSDALCTYMAEKVGAINSIDVVVYFSGSSVAGAAATADSVSDTYGAFASGDFEAGSTERWSYADGVIRNYAFGTYPVLTKSTELPKKYIDEMVSTWTARNGETYTITEDMIKNAISYNISRTGGSVYYITVKIDNDNKFTYYPTASNPYINYNYGSYYKN